MMTIMLLLTAKNAGNYSVTSGLFKSFSEAPTCEQVDKEQYVTAADADHRLRMGTTWRMTLLRDSNFLA
jgi:hypothetical protein